VEAEASYFSSTCDDDFRLNWGWPAEKIRRYISMTPGKCFSVINGERVYFHNAETESAPESFAPATVLSVGRTRAVIAAGSGAVSSSQVQVEGQSTESFAGLCRRMGLEPGDKLPSNGGER
jgi:methionyl-tRNA formyltransferase